MPTRRTWLTLLLANGAAVAALAALAPWTTEVRAPTTAENGLQIANIKKSTGAQTVTSQSPGVFRLELPAAKDGARRVLRIAVSGYKPADPPASEFQVGLRSNDQARPARVGSLAIFPSVAFEPGGPQAHRGFTFDLTKPLSELGLSSGIVDIVVTATPARASAATSGASDTLTIDNVSVEARTFAP